MTSTNVINCSFSSWYHLFKKHTIKSHILRIPEEVVQYLNSDGLVLPEGSHGLNSRVGADWDSDDEDLKEDWGDEDTSVPSKAPHFPDFDAQIKTTIQSLGGSVFPKLNWSSPKDATWITFNNSLECKTPGDIYLLLKSSTFVAHDLDLMDGSDAAPAGVGEAASDAGADRVLPELILRRWHSLSPIGEFRCFVREHNLIAVCQRQCDKYYHQIKEEEDDILEDIVTFHEDVIKDVFPDPCYVVDVYRESEDKIYVIDFNPYFELTDGLLFTWKEIEELNTGEEEPPAFRCVTSDAGVRPRQYRHYAMPTDFVDLTTGTDASKFIDLLKMKTQKDGDQSSTSSDDEVGVNQEELRKEEPAT